MLQRSPFGLIVQLLSDLSRFERLNVIRTLRTPGLSPNLKQTFMEPFLTENPC